MKCQKCNNEASFHYQSIINGEKQEYHLCDDCARAEGFGETIERAFAPIYSGFFGNPFGMPGSFFGGGSITGRAAPAMRLMPPWVNVFIGEGEPSTKLEEKSADNIPEDAGEQFRAKRELAMLKAQLSEAISAEEFEKAAEIRDRIREMER